MPKKQLIIPHYCKSCQHLTFLLREAEPFQFSLLDYAKGGWKTHSCAQIHTDLISEISQQYGYDEINETPQTIAFQHQPDNQTKKRLPLTIGIVLNISVKDGSSTVTVVTPENQMIDVRIVDSAKSVTVGRSIGLKKAVRIGKDKYRLNQVEFINPEKKRTTQQIQTPGSYYQLILSAKDQEKLETFINRLVTVCYKNRSLPVNIVPVPIHLENDEQMFQREMNLPLESGLLQKIEKITVPESVQVTVRHA